MQIPCLRSWVALLALALFSGGMPAEVANGHERDGSPIEWARLGWPGYSRNIGSHKQQL